MQSCTSFFWQCEFANIVIEDIREQQYGIPHSSLPSQHHVCACMKRCPCSMHCVDQFFTQLSASSTKVLNSETPLWTLLWSVVDDCLFLIMPRSLNRGFLLYLTASILGLVDSAVVAAGIPRYRPIYRSCGTSHPSSNLTATHQWLQESERLENDLWNSTSIQARQHHRGDVHDGDGSGFRSGGGG